MADLGRHALAARKPQAPSLVEAPALLPARSSRREVITVQSWACWSLTIGGSRGKLSRETARALTPRIVLGLLLLSLLAIGEARGAAPFIDLGPSDNLALDQPRVAIEVFQDAAGTNSFGPEFQNTFLLDTGATGILAVDGSASELVSAGYQTVGEFQETGVAGTCFVDVSDSYRVDFAGDSGQRHTLNNVHMLSDTSANFGGFGGLVGMPAMVGRVTSLDQTVWSGGGFDLMGVDFSDTLPTGNGHRYTVPVTGVVFDLDNPENTGPPPTAAPLPFMTAVPTHNGVGQAGNFVIDTGAQISFISSAMAFAIGLDANNNGSLEDDAIGALPISGLCGPVIPDPIVMEFDEIHIPTAEGVDLVWTDLQFLVLDIGLGIDGVFGSDLLTSGWINALFGGPDGYIEKVHFDFRNMPGDPQSQTPGGTGAMVLDLNGDLDQVVFPPNFHRWNAPGPTGSWDASANWEPGASPAGDWHAVVDNRNVPGGQTAVVGANSVVDEIQVLGTAGEMTLEIQNGVELTATSRVEVAAQGTLRVDGGLSTTNLDVFGGGAIHATLASPSAANIRADHDVTIAAAAALSILAGTPPASGAHLFPIIQADADGVGGGTLSGTFDAVLLPGDDGLGRRYSLLYENRAASGVGVVDTVKIGLARPGDSNFDGIVEAFDLIGASPLFGTTNPANWRQGNWNDTGSSQGIVDALDLFDTSPFFNMTYGGGDLLLGGDVTTPGQGGDGSPSIIYDFTSGEILIDTDGNTTSTYVLDSLAGIFAGFANHNPLGGTIFVTANANRLAENFHANLGGVHNLGLVAQPFLNQALLLADLTLLGGATGQANFQFDLILRNTPEPSTLALVGLGLVGLARWWRRGRTR